jgi:hypothetical protein
MDIDKVDIVSQFGDYYINEGQNEKRLLSEIRTQSKTVSYAKPIIHDGEIYRFSNVILGEIVQQFQDKFVDKGEAEFLPNEIRLRNLMVNISLYPSKVNGSWLGFLGSVTEEEMKNWPIVRYLLEKEVIPQLHHDMETKAYFKGVWEAPVTGVAGSAIKALDGIKKLLIAGAADSSMQSVALSAAVTKANAFDMVEEFVDNFDSEISGVKKRIYMDPKILKWYHQDKRNTHGADVNYNPDKPVVDFTNVELIGLDSMAGEKYFWSTPNDNFLYIRRVNGMRKPKVEEAKKEVSLMLNWWEGLGFGYNKLVYQASWV